jgi:hypothetical protein
LDFGVKTRFKSWFYNLVNVWLWTNYLTFLYFSFLKVES